jgi:uncharacterized membrane protein
MFYAIASGIFAAGASSLSKLALQQSFFIFILVLLSNYLMFRYYTLALQQDTTIKVVTINTASNILSTGIFGFLLFGEAITIKWVAGSIFIGIGSIILNRDGKELEKNK